MGDKLGEGGFAVVKRVTEKRTGKPYAVKIMQLPPVGTEPGENESTRCMDGVMPDGQPGVAVTVCGRVHSAWMAGAGACLLIFIDELMTTSCMKRVPLAQSLMLLGETQKAPSAVNIREDIFKEIDILCGLDHENIVFFKEYFEEGNKVWCTA